MTSSKSTAALAFAAALGVGAASAADLGARPYSKAPAYADALYNWSGFYVGGLEGTASAIDNRGSVLNRTFGAGDDQFSWRSNWMATVTGRIGYAVTNNLFYAKGGYAGVNNHLSVVDVVPPFVGSGSATQWHNGWTVGAGWEYGIARNWTVGLEYDYSAFETKRYQLAGTAPGVYTFDTRPRDIQSAVVRFNYKLGGPGYAAY